jgi:two-component system cell cycle sensor histidine kinase/response regulator CckA
MRQDQAPATVARGAHGPARDMDGVHLQQIIETQRAITAADLDLDAIMQLICARARELTGAKGAAVLIAVDDTLLRYAAGTGSFTSNVGETVSIHGSAAGATFLENSTLVTELGDQHGLGVSLRRGEEATGVLVAVADDADGFREDDLDMLALLSVLLSAALSNVAALESKRVEVETLGRFRKIFDGAPIGFLRLDDTARVVEANAEIVEMLGYSVEELGELGIADITDPVHLDRCIMLYGEIAANIRDSYDIEKRYIRKNGEMFWARARATVLERNAEGAPIFTILMIEDISKRKAGEQALRENSKLAEIVETQRDIAAAGLDLEAVMQLIAERALRLTEGQGAAVNLIEGDQVVIRAAGGIAATLSGSRRPLKESVTRHAAESGSALLIADSESDPRLDQRIVATTGERSHICVPFFSGGAIVGSLSVISTSKTDRLDEEDRQTLELLGVVLTSSVTAAAEFDAKRKEVEALTQFEVVWKNAPVGIQITGLDGRITATNPAMAALYGYTASELDLKLVSRLVHPDDRQRVQEHVARLIDGDFPSDTTDIAHRFVCKSGEDVSVISSTSLVRDANGTPAFVLGIIEDVTTRNAAEEQERQSQRIEAIGQLSAGIAHDFNNLLVGVLGYAGLARSELEQGSPVDGHLVEIEETARRAASLTKQLLAFGGRQTLLTRDIDLNAFVGETVAMLGRLLGAQIEIVTTLDPDLPALLADATQIQQVLLNLALNARDAMPGGGVLTIETAQVAVGSDGLALSADLAAGNYVALTVTDTGEGMSPEVKERIFEPFYTTKEVGEGTGLGLSSVYGIVKQSHGAIEVTSEAGKGATFRIYLPSTGAPVAEAAPSRTRILMVEDSDIVRGVLMRVIGDGGYDVVAAEDPEVALALLASEAPFDLLLSDIVLPGMNGVDLAARIQELQPSIRVLFMSGYPREHRVDPDRLLAKPFSNDELLEKLASTLADLATAS